ncbi:MAG: histidine kinase [Bacteroidales bacterium]|nr:histidine kinase [Bacteroidales bacterium]
MKKFTNIITGPFLISLPIAVALIIFIPVDFIKYKLDIVEQWNVDSEKLGADLYFYDFDRDGISERCYIYSNSIGNAAIKITRDDHSLIDQWNFNGKLIKKSARVFFGDYDNNGLSEVYLFSLQDDSLFLNAIEPFGCGALLKNNFITTINKVKGKLDFSVGYAKLIDLDNNSYKEVVFNIKAGFSLQPRAIYKLDIKTKRIERTPNAGNMICVLRTKDINNDGYYELYGAMWTSGNLPTTYPYHDSSVWFMVIDHNLGFFFEPVEFPGYGASLTLEPVKSNKGNRMIALYDYYGVENIDPQLLLYNEKGELLKKKQLTKPSKKEYFSLRGITWDKDTYVYMFTREGAIYNISSDLDYHIVYQGEYISGYFYLKEDFDKNGEDEALFISKRSSKISIARTAFSRVDHFDFQYKSDRTPVVSLKQNGSQIPNIAIQTGNEMFLFEYGFNKLYYLKIPYFIGIYIFSFLLVYIIQLAQRYRLRQIQKMKELQFQVTMNQLEPHFILNSLNSIGTSILEEDKKQAYSGFSKFTNLIRSVLSDQDSMVITLKEGLELTEDYLKVQNIRHKDKFDYFISYDEDIDLETLIPKMTIRNFVENALKHGILPDTKKGELMIKVFKNNKGLQISIKDNGIGRQKARELKTTGTGKGLGMMDELFKWFAKTYKVNITYRIFDLKDPNGNLAGTEVRINLPLTN